MYWFTLDHRMNNGYVKFAMSEKHRRQEVRIGRRGRTMEESAIIAAHELGHIACGQKHKALLRASRMSLTRLLFPVTYYEIQEEAEAWRWAVRRIRKHRKLTAVERGLIKQSMKSYLEGYVHDMKVAGWQRFRAVGNRLANELKGDSKCA